MEIALELINQKLSEMRGIAIKSPECKITITNSSHGYKITSTLNQKTGNQVHSYLPLFSLENFAKISAQDLFFLTQVENPSRKIQPILKDFFHIKYFKPIFPDLPGEFIATALYFNGKNLEISHSRGVLELSPAFKFTDQSAEDIYTWGDLDIGKSTQPRRFADFMLTIKNDHSGLEKISLYSGKRDEIAIMNKDFDFLFCDHPWEMKLIGKKEITHINIHEGSSKNFPFSPGFITAAAMTPQGLWVYNTLDKRLHLYSHEGQWKNSLRPGIEQLQSPFALVPLKNSGFALCDYGQIFGLDANGKKLWIIKNYIEGGISYGLPSYFSPALSPDEKDLYILDYQDEQLMYFNLESDLNHRADFPGKNEIKQHIEQLAANNEVLQAFQVLFENQSKLDPYQWKLQEKDLRIKLKKQMSQGLYSRANDWENKLNLPRARDLLTQYINEMKVLQDLEPLNMNHKERYQEALEKRNQWLQRINKITTQKPDTKDMAIIWKQNPDQQITLSLRLNNQAWSLPAIVSLSVPGADSPFTKILEHKNQLNHFLTFPCTEELIHHAALTISVAWPRENSEYIWSQSLDNSLFENEDS